jgi:hypothetical protein
VAAIVKGSEITLQNTTVLRRIPEEGVSRYIRNAINSYQTTRRQISDKILILTAVRTPYLAK